MESIAINWVSKWEVQGPIRPYLPQGEKDMKMMMTRSKSLWFVLYNFQSHGVSNHPHLSLPVPLPETPILDCKVFFFGGGGEEGAGMGTGGIVVVFSLVFLHTVLLKLISSSIT